MAEDADLLILMGSARADGDTAAAVAMLTAALDPLRAEVIALGSLNLRPFDYARDAQGDDFDGLVERILAHRRIVLATPVYWYAMSGLMKTFFDRLSDLLSDRDPARRGRLLPGRDVWGLMVGTDTGLPNGFEVPFEATIRYFGMHWRGLAYLRSGSKALPDERAARIEALAATITAAA